jgi:hypothetical protein
MSVRMGMLMIVAMLYVEKDLSQCVKVAFDKWDTHREVLNHRYFYVANMRISPYQYAQAIEKGTFSRRRGDTLFSFPLLPHFPPYFKLLDSRSKLPHLLLNPVRSTVTFESPYAS